jgi:glycosyltransferase involved in cell wall biosynthesis
MSGFDTFWRQLTERVRTTAEERDTSSQQELQQFVLQRIMARAFHRHPDRWMLKGAQSLLARFPDGRATGDVDLIGLAGNGPDGMVADLNEALGQDFGDYLTFEQLSALPLMHGEAVRIGHRVRCGPHELFDLTTDLVPPEGKLLSNQPERIPFPPQLLRTGVEGESPELYTVSIEDQLAQKISGMYMHGLRDLETKCENCVPKNVGAWACGSGELPHRVQDLVDVTFLASKLSLDAAETHAIVQADFRQRIALGMPLDLPSRFRVPNPAWVPGYVKYAAITPGLKPKTLAEAWPIVDRFVTPLLRPEVPSGRWDPEQQIWAGQDPEQVAAYAEPSRQRVLVVAHASGRSAGLGGLPVVSGELTATLAGLEGTDVTLLTFEGTEPHAEAKMATIERGKLSAHGHLLQLSWRDWPDKLGLPPAGSDPYDVVIGHSRFSGPAAKNIRNRWYRFAKLVYVMHTPAEEYAQIQGDPQRAAKYAEEEKDVVHNADLVVGVGPMLTDLARELEVSGGRVPSYHELIPGSFEREAIPVPEPTGRFNLLFSTPRLDDPVKGYDDLLLVVKQLRDEGLPVRLTVRGVRPGGLQNEAERVRRVLDTPDVVELRPFSMDAAELRTDFEQTHLVVMPSVVEGYGMVASEAAEHAVPVLVPERSGFGQLLRDRQRFPGGIGEPSVVRDAGLEGQARIDAWKSAIKAAASHYPGRREAAVRIREIQQHFTWQHAAKAVAAAMAAANPGAQRYTIQAADGVVRLMDDNDTQLGNASAAAVAQAVDREFVARFAPPYRSAARGVTSAADSKPPSKGSGRERPEQGIG